jgi:hypothetical protein
MANPSRLARRPWLRFTLHGLFFGVLFICGALAGYWNGYRQGYSHGAYAYRDEHRSQRDYRVSHMLPSEQHHESVEFLAAEIREVVESRPARGVPPGKPVEIWISTQAVTIVGSEIEHERAQAYFDTLSLSEGLKAGKYEPLLRTRRLYPVEDLLSKSRSQDGLSHQQLLGGLCTFLPKWQSSPPRTLNLGRGTLDVQGTPRDHRRVMLYLRALRAIHNPPCPS